jgi:hypothetical protein
VRGFIKLYAEGVFDPEAISLLAHAFEDAWHRVESSRAPYSTDEYAPAARTIIAKHIIEKAEAGERDPRWLADSAILFAAKTRADRTGCLNRPSFGEHLSD